METLVNLCNNYALIDVCVGMGVMVGYIAVGMIISTCIVSGIDIVLDEIKKRRRDS